MGQKYKQKRYMRSKYWRSAEGEIPFLREVVQAETWKTASSNNFFVGELLKSAFISNRQHFMIFNQPHSSIRESLANSKLSTLSPLLCNNSLHSTALHLERDSPVTLRYMRLSTPYKLKYMVLSTPTQWCRMRFSTPSL
jgi:hypothetical protein